MQFMWRMLWKICTIQASFKTLLIYFYTEEIDGHQWVPEKVERVH